MGTKHNKPKKRAPELGVPSVAVFQLEELRAAPYDPRVISDKAMAGLVKAIDRFGCVEPVVVNVRRGGRRIVGGHRRVEALRKLGAQRVLCVTVDCEPADEKLLNLTLNNPQIQGSFIKDIEAHIAALRRELKDKAPASNGTCCCCRRSGMTDR